MAGQLGAWKPDEVGRRGAQIARRLWPSIRLLHEGEAEDRNGTDAILGPLRVQIKTDATIARTHNLYVELFEKTAGKPQQRWRCSPSKADRYIFVTEGFAVWVDVDRLAAAIAAAGELRDISETSIGILVPLNKVEPKTVMSHNYWGQEMLL